MDAATLARAMGNSVPADRYAALLPAFNAALLQAGCTTVPRAAMWCAQLGHESQGLLYMREIWGPTPAQRRYEGRVDLGNTRPGDGKRFAGHGPIQITGRANHAAVSIWAHRNGYVPTPNYFVDNPDELADDRFGFLGAVWYWTVARPRLNALSDAGDLRGATLAVNGGTNGLEDREERWDRCRAIGRALLPDGAPATAPPAAGPAAPARGPDSLPTLTYGMRNNPAVASLQRWSNAYPWRPALPVVATTGNYLDDTRALMRAIQARIGVTGRDANGETVGPRTKAGLWNLPGGWRG